MSGVGPGEFTLSPADEATGAALTPFENDPMGRMLVRPNDPGAVYSDQWTETTDLITGRAIAVRRADCGAGCKCAAEVKLVGVGTPTPTDLIDLHNAVHYAGTKLRGIDYDSVFCSMTCDEAEALAEVFAAAGDLATAQHIITGHGHGDDDPEDDHHHIWLKRKEH